MEINQIERLIITYQHSNPQVVVMGIIADASGVITINWSTSHGVVFVGKPIILGLNVEGVATGETAQPICYHQEWIVDATDSRLYTGMKVYSNGKGTNIHWAMQGVVRK